MIKTENNIIWRRRGLLTGNMKKTKAFTLVEILIASVIFATVAIIASSSLSMIIAANNKADDLTSSDNCVRQVSDYTKAAVYSDHFGQRIRVIIVTGRNFRLKEYGKIASENKGNFSGIAYFTGPNTFKTIYKDTDGIYYVSGSITYISDDTDYVLPNIGTVSAIHSDSCRFFVGTPAGWGMQDAGSARIYNFNRPFQITRYKQIQLGASPTPAELAQSENRIYIINIRDVAYRSIESGWEVQTQDSANSSNIFSRLDLTLSEKDMSI